MGTDLVEIVLLFLLKCWRLQWHNKHGMGCLPPLQVRRTGLAVGCGLGLGMMGNRKATGCLVALSTPFLLGRGSKDWSNLTMRTSWHTFV